MPVHLERPVDWLAGLQPGQLLQWLRRVVTQHDPRPYSLHAGDRVVEVLAQRLSVESGRVLKDNLRTVLPVLLGEWSARDEGAERALGDVLTMCGLLRCSKATDEIVHLVRHRLLRTSPRGQPEPQALVIRALRVLAGVGVGTSVAELGRMLVKRKPYARICYRMLYRRHPEYAYRLFPQLLALFAPAGELELVSRSVELLLRDRPQEQVPDVLRDLLHEARHRPDEARRVLAGAGYEVYPDAEHPGRLVASRRNQRIGSYRQPDDAAEMLSLLDEGRGSLERRAIAAFGRGARP